MPAADGGVRNEQVLYMGELQKLSLAPDDILVISTERILSDQQREYLQHIFNKYAAGRSVLVLDGGFKLGVLSPGTAKAVAAPGAKGS